MESGAPDADASFLDLAASNPAHFSPENIARNWIPKHQLALDLAQEAWRLRHPDASAQSSAPSAEQKEAQAWLASAFSDHFLTDAFAAGHLVSGSRGRTLCEKFFKDQSNAITRGCWQCAVAEGVDPSDADVIIPAFREVLAASGRAPSLLLKTVHDYYNRNGVEVQNALGQVWRTLGDAHLGQSDQTLAMGKSATKASRDAIQDVLSTGGTNRARAALDYIPDMARLPGGPFMAITQFSISDDVWMPVLARAT